MLFKKTGEPEESEVVMCTVTNIQYSSVFATLDDYGVSGMIHISEIAAGRIRNIRDYVKEGKKVVCKILRIHKDKGHIDLSLRRVTESQRRNKVNEIKLEQKAESVIENIAKINKTDVKKLYQEVSKPILAEYHFLHHAFEAVVQGELDLSTLLDKKLATQIEEIVIQRFKPKKVEINGVLELSTYAGNGIEIVKEALAKASAVKGVTIRYLGGGKYRVTAEAGEYKEAEPMIKASVESASSVMKQYKGYSSFTR